MSSYEVAKDMTATGESVMRADPFDVFLSPAWADIVSTYWPVLMIIVGVAILVTRETLVETRGNRRRKR